MRVANSPTSRSRAGLGSQTAWPRGCAAIYETFTTSLGTCQGSLLIIFLPFWATPAPGLTRVNREVMAPEGFWRHFSGCSCCSLFASEWPARPSPECFQCGPLLKGGPHLLCLFPIKNWADGLRFPSPDSLQPNSHSLLCIPGSFIVQFPQETWPLILHYFFCELQSQLFCVNPLFLSITSPLLWNVCGCVCLTKNI